MDVSAVSGPVQSLVVKPPTEAEENWGPDNDGDADDAALTVKWFAGSAASQPKGSPAAQPTGPPAAQPTAPPAGGRALYL